MSDPHQYEVTPGIPEGKLVLVIDDDANFRKFCIGKLSRALTERAPDEKDLKLLPAGSLEKFQAILKMLEADSRKGDLVYALVDLKLPATERRGEPNQEPATENGREVCRALREWNVLHLLVSGAGLSDIDKVLIDDQMDFRSKEDFNNQETVKEVAERILCAKHKTPIISLDYCDVIASPVEERGQTRRLPLAFRSSSMRSLRNRILGRVAREAASVLLLGDPGVEFEQLAWLLFREITRNGTGQEQGSRYQYRTFNCERGASPIDLLRESERPFDDPQGQRPPTYFFIRNLHVLDKATLAQFCDELGSSSRVRLGGDRVVLTLHKGKGEGTERLLDLFCLAGFDDFILLEVPGLSGKRREDIEVYAEYYRRQRTDQQDKTVRFHPLALKLIKDLDYKRHFKDLSIFLDGLFRAVGGGMITAKVVRSALPSQFVQTAVQEILDHILTTDAEDEEAAAWSPGRLHEMCSQLLVHRGDQESSMGEDEALDQFYQELERIDEALQQASRLSTEGTALMEELKRQGPGFWPWERYPFCPRLMKHLQRNGLTVGLVEAKQ